MSLQEAVAGIPGQPSAVLLTPGVVVVTERQEVLVDSGSGDPVQSLGFDVSIVREDSGQAVTDLDNISTVLGGEGHGSGGEVPPAATEGHQGISGDPARGPAPSISDFARKRYSNSRSVASFTGDREVMRTVKITCSRLHGPYTSNEVLSSIRHIIPLLKVEAISSHGRNNEHYVVFYNKADSRTLLGHDFLVGGGPVKLESLDKEEFVIRVHWVPYWVDIGEVCATLAKYGEIVKVLHETVTDGYDDSSHILTSVRRILLTIRGRPPLCLKCKFTGHIRSGCDTPFCRHCQVYGHIREECQAGPSYASRLKQQQNEVQEIDMDDPQEVSTPQKHTAQPQVNKQHKPSVKKSKQKHKEQELPNLDADEFPFLLSLGDNSKTVLEKACVNDPERHFGEGNARSFLRGHTEPSPQSSRDDNFELPTKKKRRGKRHISSPADSVSEVETSNQFSELDTETETESMDAREEASGPWTDEATGGAPPYPNKILDLVSDSDKLEDMMD